MKRFLKFLLILLLALGYGNLNAQKPALQVGGQGKAKIDSLLLEIPKQKEDTNKVKLLGDLSFGYSRINPDEGIKYGQQGLELATKLEWKNGIAGANSYLGINSSIKSDYPKALEYYSSALKIYEEIGDKTRIAKVTGYIGIVYKEQGDFPKALEYYNKALKTDEEIGDKTNIAAVIANIGLVYQLQSDYTQALEYDQKALKMQEEAGNKQGIAKATQNIGIVYFDQSNYPKALEYFFKALKMNEETGDKQGIAKATMNIGNVYGAQSDNPKALEYFLRSLKMGEEIGDKNHIAFVNGNIGEVYSNQGDYPRALEYFFSALKINEEIGNKHGIAYNTGNIGNIYTRQKNYTMAIVYLQKALKADEEIGDKHTTAQQLGYLGSCYLSLVTDTPAKTGVASNSSEPPTGEYKPDVAIPAGKTARLHIAIDYLQQGLAMAKEIRTPDVMQNCYENLAKAYQLSGDYKHSLEYYMNYTDIKDSVFSKVNDEKIVKQGMKFEYDLQRVADSLKTADREKITELQLQHQRRYTYIGMAGILLLIGFSFFIVKERSKSERERKKSDELLLNILPAEVANELKINGTTTAKHFNNVTVMFTDFVNFTKAGENMSPQALINELHTCFKAFDDIIGRHGIEKIKTIGDAYLAVAGLPAADPDHAEHIVRAAIEINQFMADRQAKLGNSTFEVRIGIHSGSVVAGIVGVKKFSYDIWGDAVNIAARMEQTSEAGKINISETTYELVKDKFTCEYRGEIEAKNKGQMKMYFVS